jgi:pSer/pThr/pTyr-binding forkhead associated (FHA) protein
MSERDREDETGVQEEPGAPSSSGGSAGNYRTMVMPESGADELPQRAPISPRAAFDSVYERIRAAASAAHKPAVVAVAVEPRGALVAETLVEHGRVLTIGRHSQCAFRLPARDVSLRHLAAHVELGEGGAMIARLWDLKSGQPFATEDGIAARAVVAEGPLFVTVGRYVLLFLPPKLLSGDGWPKSAADGWEALPPRQFIDRKTAAQPVPGPVAPAERRLGDMHERGISRITRVQAPAMLGAEAVRGPVWAEIAVEDAAGVATHPVSAEQIDRGVLVGRSSRCQVGVAADDSVSRVHLLIVRIGREVWAIDTASTNGTTRTGCEVEAVILRDKDTLQLASAANLYWKRLVHAVA